jgi:hypothetical protein
VCTGYGVNEISGLCLAGMVNNEQGRTANGIHDTFKAGANGVVLGVRIFAGTLRWFDLAQSVMDDERCGIAVQV